MTSSAYVLDNDNRAASPMLDTLSAILDPLTRRRLAEAGIAPGGRCLEIGAGNGSVAVWLADQVGAGGSVLATDINPVRIPDHPRVRVLRHDIGVDDPLEGPFDLIHARLVLAHLPAREEIVQELVGWLRPGGALLVEDWGQWVGPLLTSPCHGAGVLYRRYQDALLEVFQQAGNDPGWARRTAGVLGRCGLAGVDVLAEARSWTGGTAGCRLPVIMCEQVRQPLLAAGLAPDELVELVRVLQNPATAVLGNVTLSSIGRRR